MTRIVLTPYRANPLKPASADISLWREIFLYLLLFGLEFDIRLGGALTLRKIVFVAMLLFIGWKGVPRGLPFRRELIPLVGWTAALFAYGVYIQHTRAYNAAIEGNQAFTVTQLLGQCLFLIVFPLLLTWVFDSAEEFLHVQLAVLTTQAIVAVLSRFSGAFRMFIYYHFVPDSDGRLEAGMASGTRVGMLGAAGATGSWILFIGCALCFYSAWKTRKVRYLLLYFLFLLALMFVGRTGLYMGLALLVLLFFHLLVQSAGFAVKLICFGVFGFLALVAYVLFAPDSYLKQATIRWVGEIFIKGVGEGSTVRALVDMGIPPLTAETFWGTGIMTGTTVHGSSTFSDVGYVRYYMALGIVGAVLYYLWAYGFLAYEWFHIRDRFTKRAAGLFLLFLMIAELKEPFLQKTPNAMFLASWLLLQRKEEEKSGGAYV